MKTLKNLNKSPALFNNNSRISIALLLSSSLLLTSCGSNPPAEPALSNDRLIAQNLKNKQYEAEIQKLNAVIQQKLKTVSVLDHNLLPPSKKSQIRVKELESQILAEKNLKSSLLNKKSKNTNTIVEYIKAAEKSLRSGADSLGLSISENRNGWTIGNFPPAISPSKKIHFTRILNLGKKLNSTEVSFVRSNPLSTQEVQRNISTDSLGIGNNYSPDFQASSVAPSFSVTPTPRQKQIMSAYLYSSSPENIQYVLSQIMSPLNASDTDNGLLAPTSLSRLSSDVFTTGIFNNNQENNSAITIGKNAILVTNYATTGYRLINRLRASLPPKTFSRFIRERVMSKLNVNWQGTVRSIDFSAPDQKFVLGLDLDNSGLIGAKLLLSETIKLKKGELVNLKGVSGRVESSSYYPNENQLEVTLRVEQRNRVIKIPHTEKSVNIQIGKYYTDANNSPFKVLAIKSLPNEGSLLLTVRDPQLTKIVKIPASEWVKTSIGAKVNFKGIIRGASKADITDMLPKEALSFFIENSLTSSPSDSYVKSVQDITSVELTKGEKDILRGVHDRKNSKEKHILEQKIRAKMNKDRLIVFIGNGTYSPTDTSQSPHPDANLDLLFTENSADSFYQEYPLKPNSFGLSPDWAGYALSVNSTPRKKLNDFVKAARENRH